MKSPITTGLGVFIVAAVSSNVLDQLGVENAPLLVVAAGLIAIGAVMMFK